MTTLTTQRMSIEEFYAWAETEPDGRFELVDGEVVRMAPERLRHTVGKAEVWLVLRTALVEAGRTNAIFTDGVHIRTGPRTSRGPDCIVAAGSGHDLDAQSIDDPLIVVEVVSPSSEQRDSVDKLAEYFGLPTVEHYLIVWPREALVEHWRRNGPSGSVKATMRQGDRLVLDPPGIAVDVTALLGAAAGH